MSQAPNGGFKKAVPTAKKGITIGAQRVKPTFQKATPSTPSAPKSAVTIGANKIQKVGKQGVGGVGGVGVGGVQSEALSTEAKKIKPPDEKEFKAHLRRIDGMFNKGKAPYRKRSPQELERAREEWEKLKQHRKS